MAMDLIVKHFINGIETRLNITQNQYLQSSKTKLKKQSEPAGRLIHSFKQSNLFQKKRHEPERKYSIMQGWKRN